MEYEFSHRILAEALYEALTEDAFYITLEKSVTEGSAREAMLRYLDYSMVEAHRYGVLLISADHKSGAALWSRPLKRELEREKQRRKRDFIIYHMGQSCLESYQAMVAFMTGKSAPQIDADAWYLSIVGIHPRSQGRGHGVDLVEEVLQKTDRMNRPTYLETFSPRNISFYERLGYRSIDRIHEPTSRADYWIMSRESKDRPNE